MGQLANTAYSRSPTVGEGYLFYRPRGYRADSTKRAVIFATGAGGNALTTQGSGFRRLPQFLADAGIPLVSIDVGNSATAPTSALYAWGNDLAATRIEHARTVILPALGLANDKMALLGGSAGFVNICQYARQFPTRVAALAGHVGLVALQAFRDANTGGYQAAIDTQYGGSGAFATAAPTHDPAQFTATVEAGDYPKKGWWSSDDAFIPEASVDTFVAAAPSVVKVDTGNTGHSVPADYDQATADFLGAVI